VEGFLGDLRSGWRALRARPGLTVLAILTLVIGIGANGAVFSVVNAVLLRPLQYAEPHRLVMLWEADRRGGDELEMTSLSNYLDFKAGSESFRAMAAWGRPAALTLTSSKPAQDLSGCEVTASLFQTLGVAPQLGRTFLPEEEIPGKDRVVVISQGLWQSMFGASPEVIGSALMLGETAFQVVGVMPSGFKNPSGAVDLWLPLAMSPNEIDRGQNYLQVVARLEPDVTLEQAQAEMNSIAAALERQYPNSNTGTGVRLIPLTEQVVGSSRPLLLIALGAVGFVLLIACANVAGLQLIKAAGREREIAVRAAMGASRMRIIRQLLTESLLLALIGGAGGALAALWGQELLLGLVHGNLPRADEVRMDWIAVWFMLAVSLTTGIVMGLAPAFYAATRTIDTALRGGGGRTVSSDPRHRLWRQGFAVAQISVALVLLVGGGLLVKSFVRLRGVNPGFNPDNLVVARLTLGPAYKEEQRRVAYFQSLTERLKALPQVRGVGAVTLLPMNPFGIDFDVPYHLPGTPEPERAAAPKTRFRSATPDYFRTMGIALLAGRAFDSRERQDSPRVVIVNRTLARRVWPNEEPIGKRLRFFWADWQTYEVVGVSDDTKSYALAEVGRAELFVPYAQNPYRVMNVVVRAQGDAASLAPAIRAQILELDPLQPASKLTTMKDLLSDSTAREEMAATLVAVLAMLALLLALTGVYGVVSYSVSQRTREIGIRIALGAQRGHIFKMVVGGAFRMTLLGLALGLPGAMALARGLSGQLFEVGTDDPLVFLSVPALLVAATLLASYVPARRAAGVRPSLALRADN
jgi:putative ABC transport system permease protein